MSVNFQRFLKWAKDRFGENIIVKGKEIRLNSIFEDDQNYHLWCSPSGGKKNRPFGVFHCFKTDRKGSLVRLIQIVDHCERDEALAVLKGYTTVRDLERKLEDFFSQQDQPKTLLIQHLTLPSGTVLISSLKTNNWWRKKAEEYLTSRKIPIDGLYICTETPYKFRIIIPYYDRVGKLIYWNGRHIFPKAKIRYLGPPKDLGVGKGDVVYVPGNWPKSGELIYLCEGEFNAISLKLSSLPAAACGGKNMTDKQALLLADYRICLCLDRDKAGKTGTTIMSNAISMLEAVSHTKEKLFVVRPPKVYKDWNEMYVAEGRAIVYHYIVKNSRPLTYYFPSGMGADWSYFIDF